MMAITGHKNEQSVAYYDHLDLDDQLHLGEILSRSSNSSDAGIHICLSPRSSCLHKSVSLLKQMANSKRRHCLSGTSRIGSVQGFYWCLNLRKSLRNK